MATMILFHATILGAHGLKRPHHGSEGFSHAALDRILQGNVFELAHFEGAQAGLSWYVRTIDSSELAHLARMDDLLFTGPQRTFDQLCRRAVLGQLSREALEREHAGRFEIGTLGQERSAGVLVLGRLTLLQAMRHASHAGLAARAFLRRDPLISPVSETRSQYPMMIIGAHMAVMRVA